MRLARWSTLVVLAAGMMASPSPAGAPGQAERIADLLHSDVPLYNFRWKEIYPDSFTDGDEFGCQSRVSFGDWRFVPDPSHEDGEEAWWRFSNYGVFHCAALARSADTRAELDKARHEYGYFVLLGRVRHSGAGWELWALQQGIRPGSAYVLLARPAGPGLIKQFTMLQQRCPSSWVRQTRDLDIWYSRYCAIGSRHELLSLARAMLRHPPLGMLTQTD